MPPTLRSPQGLLGQKPQRTFRNKYTKFFFTELDKGITSPYLLILGGGLCSLLAYYVMERYIEPRREQLARRKLVPRVPLDPQHNAYWGLGSREREGPSDPRTTVALGEVHSEDIYAPQTSDVEGSEEALRRPRLIHTERSELRTKSGDVDIVCLELPEYDPNMKDDIFYRSVHYVPLNEGDKGSKKNTEETSVKEAKESYGSNQDYLQFIPGKGEDVIHGVVKCKAITAENNCVPYAGHLEDEVSRKLMLTLGPVHILRDIAKSIMPYRFTFVKQVPVETLIVGLHGGGLARWLSSAFPNFTVDVVEPDGSLVRLCRRYLGFRESNNLHLWVSSPIDFLRHTAASAQTKDSSGSTTKNPKSKQYDLVLIDAMDGAGHLSPEYGRLEFVNTVRNSMSNNGCVAMALPNQNASFVYNMVQNWRMAFSGRSMVLVHCMTAPVTLLMTFQDNAERGKSNLGSVASVEEFGDILRSHLGHYGHNRVPFDLTKEINKDNFRVLDAGRSYPLAFYLPPGHPAAKTSEKKKKEAEKGLGGWLKRAAEPFLSPSQKADAALNR